MLPSEAIVMDTGAVFGLVIFTNKLLSGVNPDIAGSPGVTV
jgi:hypothetical protein